MIENYSRSLKMPAGKPMAYYKPAKKIKKGKKK